MTTPCPHCGRPLHNGNPAATHLAHCIAAPAQYAAVRAALDDGSGGCVAPGRYTLRRGKLPTAGGLRRQVEVSLGRACTWDDVAAYFKLLPTGPRACPHCGRMLGPGRPAQGHLQACIANPALHYAVRQALDDGDGVCLTEGQWATRHGKLPSTSGLRGQVGAGLDRPCTWQDVGAYFGLVPSGRVVGRVDWVIAQAGKQMDDDQDEYWETLRHPWELNVARVERTAVAVVETDDGWDVTVSETRYMLR